MKTTTLGAAGLVAAIGLAAFGGSQAYAAGPSSIITSYHCTSRDIDTDLTVNLAADLPADQADGSTVSLPAVTTGFTIPDGALPSEYASGKATIAFNPQLEQDGDADGPYVDGMSPATAPITAGRGLVFSTGTARVDNITQTNDHDAATALALPAKLDFQLTLWQDRLYVNEFLSCTAKDTRTLGTITWAVPTSTPTPTADPSESPTPTPEPTPSETPSPTPSQTPSPAPSETASPSPTASPTPTQLPTDPAPSGTPSPSPIPSSPTPGTPAPGTTTSPTPKPIPTGLPDTGAENAQETSHG